MLQVSQRDYVEKAAQADAGDEEHHRDEQLNHAADNNTALAAPKRPAGGGAFTGAGLSASNYIQAMLTGNASPFTDGCSRAGKCSGVIHAQEGAIAEFGLNTKLVGAGEGCDS